MPLINRLRISFRILVSILFPVLLTAFAIAWVSIVQIKAIGEEELNRLETNLLESRRSGLKDTVDVAHSVVMEIKESPGISVSEAKRRARTALRSISFGKDNYVIAFGPEMENLAYRPDPSMEGPTEDPKLRKLLTALVQSTNDDGFHTYTYMNSEYGEIQPKLSYQRMITGWGWLIGAGVNIADVSGALEQARRDITARISETLMLISLVSLGIVVVAVLIGMFASRSVSAPIAKISAMMREIASGEGDLRHRLPESGGDELAELGRCFNAFVRKIQQIIGEVGVTTNKVAHSAKELSQVAAETNHSVQEQGIETDQIASAINEMATTIQQVSENANGVESAASDADQLAREGGRNIAETQEAVRKLTSEIQESATSIEALSAKTAGISQILDVIHGVTEQTNLLALNAAIEAARAGEHGRGFSVVADEVRQLARRSAESAEQIREMLDGFVAESSNAVERMKTSRGSAFETVERINGAAETLGTIEKSVGDIHDQVSQIATAAEQQSQVAEEINQNVVRIVDAAQRSDSGVTRTNEASSELAQLGDNLRELVQQFKT
ncbi:methyl-accepting chemotaxis protein [Marinobacter sp. GN3S48]|uniref:methyl-accepting chemotaxis protein n=1 Tax=Marinobacter sp. GN3S48 TaxID=3382302 RepID=UPI00387AD76A